MNATELRDRLSHIKFAEDTIAVGKLSYDFFTHSLVEKLCPFKVGDRVRITPNGRPDSYKDGVIAKICYQSEKPFYNVYYNVTKKDGTPNRRIRLAVVDGHTYTLEPYPVKETSKPGW